MKKKDILGLIKYHCEGDDSRFKELAHEIATGFNKMGDISISETILSYISDTNTLSIQMIENDPTFYTLLKPALTAPKLPNVVQHEIDGIKNALGRKNGVSKFLFYGPPGTGKTECVKHLACKFDRQIVYVEFDTVINSKLGETTRNIKGLFDEIRGIDNPTDYLFLFDEIDALAMDRINKNDLREMGRATSAFLKEMDRTNESFAIFATTNLFDYLDEALKRRFDATIDFGRYDLEDLQSLSVFLLESLLNQYSFASKDTRLFKKIIALAEDLPYPGDLKNLLKKCIVFCEGSDEFEYLKRLYCSLANCTEPDPETLRKEGFTLREIEKLTNISKSTLSRSLIGQK